MYNPCRPCGPKPTPSPQWPCDPCGTVPQWPCPPRNPCPPPCNPCPPPCGRVIEWCCDAPCPVPPGPTGPVCSSYDFAWKTTDCREAHATILSDANLTLFNAALATVNTNLLTALGVNPVTGVVTPINAANLAATQAALAAAISPLYDASSVNTFVTFLNPRQLGSNAQSNTLTFVPGNVSFGTAEIVGSVNALLGALAGSPAGANNSPPLALTLTLVKSRVGLGTSGITGKFVECSRLATLKTTIIFDVTAVVNGEVVNKGTYLFEVGSIATLCDCGARPIVISGNSAITFTPPPQ